MNAYKIGLYLMYTNWHMAISTHIQDTIKPLLLVMS